MKKLIAFAFGILLISNLWAQQTEPITLSDVKCQVTISQNAQLEAPVTVRIPSSLKSQYAIFLKNLDQKGSQIEIVVGKNLQIAMFTFKNSGAEVKTSAEWNAYIKQLQN